jgi:chorismate mutase/prephenate dehydratase
MKQLILQNRLRQQIDSIDKKILQLLNCRAKIAIEIGKLKKNAGRNIFSSVREQKILENIQKQNKGPLSDENLKNIFTEIISSSRSLEDQITVAYLGPSMTYTYLAAIKKFGLSIRHVSCRTINDAFLQVEKSTCNYAVVPVENSMEGPVETTLDMLVDTKLKICASFSMRISHYLLSKSVNVQKIKKIYSKDQVFGQCREYLQENFPSVELVEVSSTAEAARIAAKTKDSACIAGIYAADVYGLQVLAKNIEDNPRNTTRFIVLGLSDCEYSGKDKTSIVFAVKDRPGALYDAILPFKRGNINMTKIESRPSKRKMWEYYFFVDFLGHRTQGNVVKALRGIEKQCTYLNILGSYPLEK